MQKFIHSSKNGGYAYCYLAPAVEAHIAAKDARIAELERDAARYQWLKRTDPTGVCAIAWRERAACQFNVADEAVDAAMAATKAS